jgi:hypothetical protein
MLTAAANTVRNFFARPGAVDAIQAGDRATALAIAAQPNPEQFAPLVDELLSIEAQRDQHRARAQQLPQLKQKLAAAQREIEAAWQIEQARRAEYDRENAARLDAIANFERLKGKAEISARWLVTNVPIDVQARLDLLTGESVELSQLIAQYKEIESGLRRTAERTAQRIERLQNGPTKDHANTKNDIAQEQVIVTNSIRRADEHTAAINIASAKLARITLEVDTILAQIKRGE